MKTKAQQIIAYKWECPSCDHVNITPLDKVSEGFGEVYAKCENCKYDVDLEVTRFGC